MAESNHKQKSKIMKANIPGRLSKLRNITSYKEALLEAVANSLQSCAISGKQDAEIFIEIKTKDREESARKGSSKFYFPIDSIKIIDNGEGFTEENFESFGTMDSVHKASRFGCKGIGRFLWLKAFKKVSVDSVYLTKSGEKYHRHFDFSINDIEHQSIKKADEKDALKTTILLQSLVDGMQPKRDVTAEEIVFLLIAHFLLDFVNGNVPTIKVLCSGECLSANDVFSRMGMTETKKQTFKIEDYEFEFIQ